MRSAVATFALLAVVSGVLYDLTKVGGHWIAHRGSPWTARALLGLAVRLLPHNEQGRYHEEWASEFGDDLSVGDAAQLVAAAWGIRRELKHAVDRSDVEAPASVPRSASEVAADIEVAAMWCGRVHEMLGALSEDLSIRGAPRGLIAEALVLADRLDVAMRALVLELKSPILSFADIQTITTYATANTRRADELHQRAGDVSPALERSLGELQTVLSRLAA